jgi:hypothetical protein
MSLILHFAALLLVLRLPAPRGGRHPPTGARAALQPGSAMKSNSGADGDENALIIGVFAGPEAREEGPCSAAASSSAGVAGWALRGIAWRRPATGPSAERPPSTAQQRVRLGVGHAAGAAV